MNPYPTPDDIYDPPYPVVHFSGPQKITESLYDEMVRNALARIEQADPE